MKKGYLILICFFILQACNKENKADVLGGTWRLIEVSNDSLSTPVKRPADANGDFIITFQKGGSFSGHTFRNKFFDGSYTLSNGNQLRFGSFSATKVAEDAWGISFYNVLFSCLLQSVSPCTSSLIYIQNSRLKIITPFHDNLIFERD